jgi:signal transduction histidine kinase
VTAGRPLAEAHSALRRVAAVAAAAHPPEAVFDAVTREASALLGGTPVSLARYERGGTEQVILARTGGHVPVGMWFPATDLDGISARMWLSHRPERTDDFADRPQAGHVRELGVLACVAVPVIVEGTLWGSLAAASRTGPLPAETEDRLTVLAEIVAGAVVSAAARVGARTLADEQSALLRVAAMVARGAPEGELFDAVAAEAAGLVDDEPTTLVRYEGRRTFTVLATRNGPAPVGMRFTVPPDDPGTLDEIMRTSRPVRRDQYPDVADRSFANRYFGVGSSVSVPIVVNGALWGSLGTLNEGRRLPEETEARLSKFAELIGAALANAEARAALERLVGEQAARRRVAELVAREAGLDEVFHAVTAETSSILGGRTVTLVRHDAGGPATVVAAHPDQAPVGRAVVAVPVVVDGRVWGQLSTTATDDRARPDGTEDRLVEFAELAATALANAESRAALRASRARLVTAADEARRRLQRDVHDGAQQRLVQTVLTLKLGLAFATRGEDVTDLLGEALQHAERATAELRDTVHGIMPAALSRGGLRAGLESLVAGLDLAVDLDVSLLPEQRLPADLEVAVYFIVAEAVTNVVKHAGAAEARVAVARAADRLTIEVVDDGAGGADPGGGGLTGMADRVDAMNGTLEVVSPPGGGTTLRVGVPVSPRGGRSG